MQSVGQILRQARLQQALTLEQVSASTRISLKNLHAIEADELSKIRSVFFYKSFVRQFAEELKLDYELELADAVQESAAKLPEPLIPGQGDAPLPKGKPMRAPRRMPLRWLSSVGALVVMVVACSTLYAMWESSKTTIGAKVETLVQKIASVRKDAAPLRSAPPRPSTTAIPESPHSTPEAASASDSSVSPNAASDASSPAPLQGQPEQPSQPQQQAQSLTPDALNEDGYKIELDATERSWLSVTADGKQVYSGILEPDQTKVLQGRDTARLRTGNAGGINVVFNGKAIGSLGARGQVRTVVFTKDRYEIVDIAAPLAFTQFSPNVGQLR